MEHSGIIFASRFIVSKSIFTVPFHVLLFQVLRSIVQKCLQKNEELGGTSIAFPVIGAGNLKFPPDTASRIMLEEAITFCQAYPSSMVKDIRFVVFQQDKALVTAFTQEMANMQFENKVGSLPRLSKGGVVLARSSEERHLSIEVINGDLTQEKTDAIMNIISTEMNMNNAGELSKAILRAGGPQIQQELSQQGKQTVGTAVMTGGGSLAVRHVIHIIPGLVCLTFLSIVVLEREKGLQFGLR